MSLITDNAVIYDRARITGPEGSGILYNQHRFVFLNGKVAVWTVGKRHASRIHLFDGATFERTGRRKVPDILTLPDGTTWQVRYQGDDCGCRRSPLVGKEPLDLVDPDFHTVAP